MGSEAAQESSTRRGRQSRIGGDVRRRRVFGDERGEFADETTGVAFVRLREERMGQPEKDDGTVGRGLVG